MAKSIDHLEVEIGADIDEFNRKVDSVQRRIDGLNFNDKQIDLIDNDSMNDFNQKVDNVVDKIDMIDRKDPEVNIDVDVHDFNRKVDDVQRRIDGLKGRNFLPDFGSFKNLLGKGATGFVDTLGRGLESSSWQTLVVKMALVDAIIPTIISSVGLLAGGVAALASQVTAAAAGLGGFAVIAIPTIKNLFDLNAQLDAGTIKWSELSDAQKNAISSLKEFKGFYEVFAKAFEEPVLETFSNGLIIAKDVMKELQPMFQSVADTMVGLTESLKNNLESEDVQEFFAFLNETAAPAIENLTKGVGNFIVGFASMMEAFGPLGEDFSEGFLQMSEDFRKWAADIENNKQFQKFVEWVRENGPDLIDDLGVIADYLLDVAVALAQTGDSIIDFLADLARLQKDFQETMEDLGNIIEDIDWGEAMREIGEHVISGLIGGMDSKIDELRDKAAEIGRIVANAARSALGIRSPSRVFKEIGGYVGDGLSIGMDDSVGNIEQSSRSLAMASQRGFVQHTPQKTTDSEDIGMQQPLEIPLYINGKEFARATVGDISRALAEHTKGSSRRVGVV